MNDNPISLDKLHDIVVPEAVAWWPLAPGWYVLLLALIIAVSWTGIRLTQQWNKNRFRREALNELETISPTDLPSLVKRVCLCIGQREQVASLSGEDWLHFLDQSGSTTDFTQGPGKILLTLSYSPDASIDLNSPEFSDLKSSVRTWIQNAQLFQAK